MTQFKIFYEIFVLTHQEDCYVDASSFFHIFIPTKKRKRKLPIKGFSLNGKDN